MNEEIFNSILQNILFRLKRNESVDNIEEYIEWCKLSKEKFNIDTEKNIDDLMEIKKLISCGSSYDSIKSEIVNIIFRGDNNG